MGSAIGGLPNLELAADMLREHGPNRLTPFMLPATLINMLVGHVSIRFGVTGYCASVVSACASSAHALGDAARIIERGDASIMIAGGAEAAITPLSVGGFSAMRALSVRNDAPERASRPFDRARDGFVISEGAAALILEEREHAVARGASILAELRGYGFSADANHMTAPSVAGPMAAMQRALRDAQLPPRCVGYVNAHATGTVSGDQVEADAIRAVLGEGAIVGSTKSMTGHLLGAAGALEAAFCIRALREGFIPPSRNLDEPDPACALRFAPAAGCAAPLEAVMSNSFGFGGTNVSLVLAHPS
jgi:3-oxoacyl-[acyl-carrier-protein] synthase II